MKASLFIILFAFFAEACSRRPTPEIVSRNYQDNTIVRRVYVGSDSYGVVRFREPTESSRQRLLVSIQAECPNYQILQGQKRGHSTFWSLTRRFRPIASQRRLNWRR
jgi:hypothetical protein